MRCGPEWKPASITDLVLRFGLTEKHLRDKRIDRLLSRKVALDNEISQLHSNGVREARVQRTARLLGFTDQELANDRRIAHVIQSVFDGRQYLATLKPAVKTGDMKNAAK